MKTIYYYQTLCGLRDALQNHSAVDVIYVSSFHFGVAEPDKGPYIHLNDNDPDDNIFDQLWMETIDAYIKGIEIRIMLGGAGGAYQVLFSDFNKFYPLLQNFLLDHPWITGMDLDIEEIVALDDVKMLIMRLKADFGSEFNLTMAPVSYAISNDVPGMGGFCYKDLYKSLEGKKIQWFNVQSYSDYTFDEFESFVNNGYPAEKLVFGMISDQFDRNTFPQALHSIKAIRCKYPKLAGVFNWEYYSSPPGPTPGVWAIEMTGGTLP